MVIPPSSELSVLVVANAADPQTIESKPPSWERELVIAAQSVANILPLVQFYVLETSLLKKRIDIP